MMVTDFSYILAILFISSVNNIIIPIDYEQIHLQCNDHQFKIVPNCDHYNEQYGLVTEVLIGPAGGNGMQRHSVKLLVDTGSSETWVGNYNTKVYTGLQEISWRDFTKEPTLFYDFQPQNRQYSLEKLYGDGDRVNLIKYSNQAMLFREYGTGRNLLLNMSINLAQRYYTKYDLFASGILGLSLPTDPQEDDNALLHRFGENPDNNRTLSFDLRWNHVTHQPLPSCFAIGESVYDYNRVEAVTLNANPYRAWAIAVSYVQINFINTGNNYTLPHKISDLDVGGSKIFLPANFVRKFKEEIEMNVFSNMTFPCRTIVNILPEIHIGFTGRDGRTLQFNFTQNQLVHVSKDDQNECFTALSKSDSMSLGRPFFSNVYMEMHWDDTTTGSVLLSGKN